MLCPKLTLFQVTWRPFPADGKVLDLNSISSIHSDSPWPYPGHVFSSAPPSAPFWPYTASLRHLLLAAVRYVRPGVSKIPNSGASDGATSANQPKGISGNEPQVLASCTSDMKIIKLITKVQTPGDLIFHYGGIHQIPECPQNPLPREWLLLFSR